MLASSVRPYFVCLTGLLSALTWAQIPGLVAEKPYDFGGYVKYMASANIVEQGDDYYDHLIHQRFNFEYRFDEAFRVNLSMRNRVLWGDSTKLPGYSTLIGADAGYWDLTTNWLERGSLIGTSQFDRAYVQWSDNDWQLRAGRSRINWAMNTIWNPNDVFNAYSIYDFDYEERSGTDALSVTRKLDFASSIDVVFSPNQESDLTSYAGRYLYNYQGWDMQVIAGKSNLDRILAGGVAGDIKGAGVRAEVSWFEPTKERWNDVELSSTTVASIESDYSFTSRRNWMGRIAYLYISQPQSADSAAKYLNLPLNAKTLSFSRNTYYADLGFDISPLWRATFATVYYQDHSYYLSLNSHYSLSDDIQLIGVIQKFDGREDSLFGETPATLLFAQIKWSF